MWKYRFQYPNLRFVEGEDPTDNTGGGDDPQVDDPKVEEEETRTPAELAASIKKLEASLAASREDIKKVKAERAAEIEKLKAEKMTAEEKVIEEAKKTGASEVSAKYANRLLSERVRSLATGKFAEPQDALMFLKDNGTFAEFKLNDDLDIDDDEITKALNDVAKARPHWLKDATKTASAKDAGVGGQSNKNTGKAKSLEEAITAKYNKAKK